MIILISLFIFLFIINPYIAGKVWKNWGRGETMIRLHCYTCKYGFRSPYKDGDTCSCGGFFDWEKYGAWSKTQCYWWLILIPLELICRAILFISDAIVQIPKKLFEKGSGN